MKIITLLWEESDITLNTGMAILLIQVKGFYFSECQKYIYSSRGKICIIMHNKKIDPAKLIKCQTMTLKFT